MPEIIPMGSSERFEREFGSESRQNFSVETPDCSSLRLLLDMPVE
jgi:hypothetical protein